MRLPRIKRVGKETIYHCFSHLVSEAAYLSDVEKEYFVKRMRKLARFCGIFVVDYSIMSNHFHIIAKSPAKLELSDKQLLAKLVKFYGKHSEQAATFQDVANGHSKLQTDLRSNYIKRMGDISVFIKELKEGFTRWYNKRHERRGTLWSARFGSEIVENDRAVIRVVAAYVTLNAVRAWLVDDPKDYRFCGYAAALAGDKEARAGLRSFLKPGSWRKQASDYRVFLFGTAGRSGHSSKRTIDAKEIERIGKAGGALQLSDLLRLRVRYMTDGAVLGSAAFVNEIWSEARKQYNPRRKSGARKMRGGKVWSGLCTMRDLRKSVFEAKQRSA